MTVGPTAAVDPLDRYVQTINGLEARIADLERASRRDIGALPMFSTRFVAGRVASGAPFDLATSGTTKLTAGATASTPMSAGRKYMARLELQRGWYGTVGADNFSIAIEEDGTPLTSVPVYVTTAGQYITPGSLTFPFTTTAASHVYQAAATRSVGTGSLQFRGQLHIYDDGV